MDDKDEYKGIFYEDNSERNYYEGGAHFSYEELFNTLLNIQKQQIINENKNKSLNKKNEIDKERILKQVPIVSRQKNFSMKNIFSCDNQIIKNKIQKINNNNIKKKNNDNNLKMKKLNFLRNNISKEKSLSKKKNNSKKKNINQSNSVIHLGSGQCLNININNNYNNNFINLNPNSNLNNNLILSNNNNSNPLRFLKEIINENKSSKKKPQSRNSKSKGRNYKRKKINSSIELNHEYNYNYNYYLVEEGLDKFSKMSGNRHSGKSTGAQPSNSIQNLSLSGLNNLTKYSQSNIGYFGLKCLDNSINNSKIFNKKNTSSNKKRIMDSENQMKKNDNNYIFLDNNKNRNNKDINNKNIKNKSALSHDKNNKNNFNSFINKKVLVNNFCNNNNEIKQSVLGPIILNEKNIKKLKNFNMTIFNLSTSKNKNSSSKDKKINFNLNNNKNNNKIKENNNIFNNNNNTNRNILKFTNQSLLKSICLQKQNSRNIFNCSKKNKIVEKNLPEKLAEKSCNVVGKYIEQQNNISRNSNMNYDKLIKSFEG